MKVLDTPGLRGLEIWRGIARGLPLHLLSERKADYLPGLREFLVQLHDGTATADDERETQLLQQAAGFARLVLCGGGALDPSLATVLRDGELPFAYEVDDAGPFSGFRGAQRIFRDMGWRRGVALDLGQVQLKVMTQGWQTTVQRDTTLLPFGATSIDAGVAMERLREMLRTGLREALAWTSKTGEKPDGVVLALPVALDADGVAEPATYPGLFGPVQAIFAELFECPCVVLNDAVLAGAGFAPRSGEKTLVVTLGFGVGGALWTQER